MNQWSAWHKQVCPNVWTVEGQKTVATHILPVVWVFSCMCTALWACLAMLWMLQVSTCRTLICCSIVSACIQAGNLLSFGGMVETSVVFVFWKDGTLNILMLCTACSVVKLHLLISLNVHCRRLARCSAWICRCVYVVFDCTYLSRHFGGSAPSLLSIVNDVLAASHEMGTSYWMHEFRPLVFTRSEWSENQGGCS